MGNQQAAGSHGAALIYCRVSTKAQEEEGTSLDSQETECRRHSETLGYVVARVTREVYSGAELWDRPKLAQDRADIKAGRFQALICHSTDRLSRNPVHLALIAEECDRAGVALSFVTEPLDNSPEGQLIRYVRGYAGQVEREKIRERQLRGKRTRVQSGKIHGHGPELYGYRRDKAVGIRTVYEPEATVVRQVFTWMVEGHLGTVSIARRLNEQGIPPPSAGKLMYSDAERRPRWGKSQVRKIVQHPAYKGETIEWRHRRVASQAERRRPDYDAAAGRVIRPEAEWIYLPDGITPPIVSAEVWQAAQEALRERRAVLATRNAARPYLLRGLVWCANCGRRMYGSVENTSTTHSTRIVRSLLATLGERTMRRRAHPRRAVGGVRLGAGGEHTARARPDCCRIETPSGRRARCDAQRRPGDSAPRGGEARTQTGGPAAAAQRVGR